MWNSLLICSFYTFELYPGFCLVLFLACSYSLYIRYSSLLHLFGHLCCLSPEHQFPIDPLAVTQWNISISLLISAANAFISEWTYNIATFCTDFLTAQPQGLGRRYRPSKTWSGYSVLCSCPMSARGRWSQLSWHRRQPVPLPAWVLPQVDQPGSLKPGYSFTEICRVHPPHTH